MDLIKTVSTALGIICTIIGVLLLPLGIWLLSNGLKNKDRPSIVIAILLFALAALTFFGAYSLFTQGILQTSPYLQPGR
jgi:drug/metabolite transporter (DMT)-like permease